MSWGTQDLRAGAWKEDKQTVVAPERSSNIAAGVRKCKVDQKDIDMLRHRVWQEKESEGQDPFHLLEDMEDGGLVKKTIG